MDERVSQDAFQGEGSIPPTVDSKHSSKPAVEIIHGSQYDIIINNRVEDDPERVQTLLREVQQGIPENWVNLPRSSPLLARNIFIDRQENPHFVAKVRANSSKAIIRAMRESIKDNPDNYWGRMLDHPMPSMLALNSLLNELYLSPQISAIVASEEATKIAQQFGYTRIEFVQPLVGIIDRSTGIKIAFYDYVAGEELSVRFYRIDQDAQLSQKEKVQIKKRLSSEGDEFVNDLIELFKNRGITPYDLALSQFIYPPNGQKGQVLYLLDTEGFTAIKR